jgi:ribosome maturation factor RimP
MLKSDTVHCIIRNLIAGWSSLAARRAHNPKVVGSNPAPATSFQGPVHGAFLFMT